MTSTPTLFLSAQQVNFTDLGTPGDDQTSIKLVEMTNGQIGALWLSNTDSVVGVDAFPGLNIVGRRFSAEGTVQGSDFFASMILPAEDQVEFDAIATTDGGFAISLVSTNGSNTYLGFYKQVQTDNAIGGSISNMSAIGVDAGGSSIAVAADGSVFVAFQQRTSAGSDQYQTRATKVVTFGQVSYSFPSETFPTEVGPTWQRTAIAALKNGNFAIVGQSHLADTGFYLGIVSPSGNAVLSPTPLSDTVGNGFADRDPAIAALGGGGFVTVWSRTDAGNTDIVFQRYTAAGIAVGSQVKFADDGTIDNDTNVDVISLNDGGFAIVWHDQQDSQIAMRRFSSNGSTVGTRVTIADSSSGTPARPTIAATKDGRILVGWQTSTPAGAGNVDTDVKFAIYDPRDSIIFGTAESDHFTSRKDGAVVSGLAGNDTLLGQGVADTLRGDAGFDSIRGGAGNDVLEGGADADTLHGDDGNDLLYGYTSSEPDAIDGYNAILGGLGNDTIFGSGGNETLEGDSGDDLIQAGSGIDEVRGGTGNDTINGAKDTDYIAGDTGNDLINGGDGNDQLNGGDDRDTINGGNQNDVIDGGLGNDILNGEFGDDTIDGNLGNDTIDGGNGHDVLNGFNGNDSVSGGNGNETIEGGAGNDTINGGAGQDQISGGDGRDRMIGGASNDFYTVDDAGDVIIELSGEGAADTVNTRLASLTLAANVERLNYTGFGNFVGIGNSGSNRFTGGAGADRFVDILGGNDTFSGGNGPDSMDFRSSATGVVLNFITNAHGGAAAGDFYASIEKYFGSNIANDSMTGGGNGRFVFTGGGGNDTLVGAGNIDNLQGQAGADSISGLAGIDSLDGGSGNDTLTGGAAKDYFVYSAAGFGQDIITDFQDGLDKLKVHSSIASNISAFNITGNGTTSVVLTQISAPANTITLQGVGLISITGADFVFY